MFESVNIQPMTNPSVDQNTPSSNQRMEKLPPKVSQQPRFLAPPQHHTPDSVLHLLSSVLPLLSVNFLMTAALSSSIFPSLLCSYFFRSFAHFQQIPQSLSEDWISFYQKLNTIFLFLNAFNSVDTKCSYVFPSSSQLSSTFDDISLGPHGKTNVVKSSVSFAGSTWASIAASSARTAWVTFCWTSPGEMSSWCVCI